MARVRYSKSGRANYTTTSKEYSTQIVGLKAFARALKKVGEDYPKALREANYDLSTELIKRTQLRASLEGAQAAKAARSIRAVRSSNMAMVQAGGVRAAYFFGAEFGSKRYGQFQRWRGNQHDDAGWDGGPGYFLHPTIRNEADELIAAYMEQLNALMAQAFPKDTDGQD